MFKENEYHDFFSRVFIKKNQRKNGKKNSKVPTIIIEKIFAPHTVTRLFQPSYNANL